MARKMAQVIRARRAAKGWTQQELADRVRPRVNQSYIALLEKAERTPSLAMLKRLAKALSVPVTELLE